MAQDRSAFESASDALARARECIERSLVARDRAIADSLNALDEVQQELVRQCEQAVQASADCPGLSETEARQLYMQFADELLDIIKIIKQRRARIVGEDDDG